jgi:pre-mRNA-processing factor 40
MEYMKNLEKLDYEEKKRIRRYHERKNRELFRELLAESFRQGMFTIKTKWNQYVATVKDEARYLNLVGQFGSTPQELFDDFILAEKENFKRQKGTLKQIIKVRQPVRSW